MQTIGNSKTSLSKIYVRRLVSGLVFCSVILSSTMVAWSQSQPPIRWIEKVGDHAPVGNGFGRNTSISTRGMTIYKNELYVGIENIHKFKIIRSLPQGQPSLVTAESQGYSALGHQDGLQGGVVPGQIIHQGTDVLPNGSYSGYPEFLLQGAGENGTYLYSPDGGQNQYYLDEEMFGSHDLLNDIFEVFGSLTMVGALHVRAFWSDGCEIWKYNATTDTWTQIIGNLPGHQGATTVGFGYTYNYGAAVMKEFKGKLYVGTWNTPLGSLEQPLRKGCEVWRYDGHTWEQVVGVDAGLHGGLYGGFESNPLSVAKNMAACSIEEFNGYLYIGTMNFDFTDDGGCQIWRTNDGLNWQQVVTHGFRPNMTYPDLHNGVTNTYAWIMKNYSGKLYVGTFNSRRVLGNGSGGGCQLWCTGNGVNWTKVLLPNGTHPGTCDGFGEWQNYGIRRMDVYHGILYLGTATNAFTRFNPDQGCEVWRYDGTPGLSGWDNIVGEKAYNEHAGDPAPLRNLSKDGFGNVNNKYAWGMTNASNGLWVGAAKDGGCQVFCYDGAHWYVSVRTPDGEKPDGFGDHNNSAVRSMIEYPKGSGIIVAGTFTSLDWLPEVGCEVWMRYP